MSAKQQHLAAYTVIATVIWEFFSYYGMRALLVLYLTQKLVFSDHHPYALYGAYTSLIYVTPIIGGWIADRWLGFKKCVVIGALLIILAHVSLFFSSLWNLYLGLSLLVLGVGFFKGNSICMIGKCYDNCDSAKDTAFAIYYVGGNIGATLGPIVTAYLANQYGWPFGFAAAGVGMACGLAFLLFGWKRLKHIGNAPIADQPAKERMTIYSGITLIAIIALIATFFIMRFDLAGYVLLVVGLVAILMVSRVYKNSSKKEQKGLWVVFFLTLFGVLFWAFDQQGGSSISLFILRNIHKHGIPTAMFQSINPFIIILFGSFIAWSWGKLSRLGITPHAIIKMFSGFVLLTIGFGIIAFGAHVAELTGQANMVWPVVGLCLIGMAELFIDPVVLAQITRSTPIKSLGLLTGMYYLFTGAFANYIAAQIAQFTAIGQGAGQHVSRITAAAGYQHTYIEVTLISAALALALLIWFFGRRKA